MEKLSNNEVKKTIESTAGAGFTDWKIRASEMGNKLLLNTLKNLDREPANDGRNAHHVILDKLKELNLPTEDCLFIELKDFLDDPYEKLEKIPSGDYYFTSIEPGKHLANTKNKQDVIDFVRSYYEDLLPEQQNEYKEIFISHNGDAVMSGHIIVSNDGTPNSLYAEFTVGNFNAFHRGFTSPEIILEREYKNQWSFCGQLDPGNEDWRTLEEFDCAGDFKMSRLIMAELINQSIIHLPQDDGNILPGTYEVLFERKYENQISPVFIEAVV